jgi:alkanesulfonate monooxygenase SsuD/methylene tetrahydromethanopterin reductase-like flavin-dependent oxidoreductase (luciferase family)
MPPAPRPSFGIATAPMQVPYQDILRVWREADAIPEIEHAWLFDPPILVAGRSASVLRVAAEHADLWNIAGGDTGDAAQRSALLDRYCTEVGRDPAAITRSIHLPVSYDQPGTTRDAISEALDAGFTHITLGLPAQPYPANVAQWVADELIAKSAQ